MKAKKKICSGCGEDKYIWKNHEGEKYCQYCWGKYKSTNEKPVYKKRVPIQPRSKKKIELDKAYSKLRRIFLTERPMCAAALVGCTKEATDVHHMKGRGKYYLVVSTWLPVCRQCHTWIELHPVEATDLGFRESKIV